MGLSGIGEKGQRGGVIVRYVCGVYFTNET